VGVTAPAFAASSGTSPTVISLGGCRCGTGGGSVKTYRLDVAFSNTTSHSFTITEPAVVVSGVPGNNVEPPSGTVPPGTPTLSFTFTRGSNPATDVVTFSYTYKDNKTGISGTGAFTANVLWGTCDNLCA